MTRARLVTLLVVVAILVASCAATPGDTGGLDDLPVMDVASFETHLIGSDRPAVVNVWASWCAPCRSDMPLLAKAHDLYGDRIEFIGVDVLDTQQDAKAFLTEFAIRYDNFFDPHRAIVNYYGGRGTPVTFFFARGGELVATHSGVIDERTLALGIDELLRSAS